MSKLAKVEGELVTKDGTGTAIEFYEADFVLDDAVKDLKQARSIIRKGLITEHLRKSVKNFKRVRTCQVVDFAATEKQAENTELDKLLLKATQLNCVPENIDNYKRVDFKTKALEKAIEKALERKAKAKLDPMKDEGYVDD